MTTDVDRQIEADKTQESLLHRRLYEVAEFLKPSISEAESSRLPQTVGLASTMMDKEVQVHPEMLDASDPDSVLRLSLILAFCDQWITARGNFALRQKLSESILLLIPESNRNYIESEETLRGRALDDQTTLILLSEAFPNAAINWTTTSLAVAEKKLAVDGIIRLPYRIGKTREDFASSEAAALLNSVYDKAGIEEHERAQFRGLYSTDSKVIILWEDSPRKTEIHEALHRDNDGLLVGGLGTVLNEAITDMRAYQIWRDEGATEEDIASEMSKKLYLQSIRLIESLYDHSPQFKTVVNRYYEQKNENDAKELILLLISLLGLKTFAALYAASPSDPVVVQIQMELEQKRKKTPAAFSLSM